MNPIPAINAPPIPLPQPFQAEQAGSGKETFKNFMIEAIQQVNGMQQEADSAIEQLVSGGDVNMAEVLTMVQKADMSFRMMMQMRNKLMQAYQEIKDIRI